MQTLDLQCCLHSWSINLYLKTLPTTVNNRLETPMHLKPYYSILWF
jgi:hypothetical protein